MTGQDQSAPSYEQTLLAEGGGFVYGTINADVHVFADRGPIYMLENYRTVRKPSSEWLIAQPSRALRADYAVVDFSGRDKELATLSNWRDSSAARLAALWLHGPGGQGKSRLAREFIEQSVHEGWKAVTATHSAGSVVAPPGSQDLRVGDAPGVLLVVDYADRWPVSHLAWLFSNALLHQLTPARILLLARSSHIWPAVRAALTRHEAGLADLPLPALLDERDERERMFAVARDCFAAVYGLPSADLPAVPALHRMEYGLVLAVQTAALVGVDAAARGVRPPQDALTASAYLLDRERQHWTKLFEGRTEGVEFDTRPAEMARAVFVAALTGVTRYQDGRRILAGLRRVP